MRQFFGRPEVGTAPHQMMVMVAWIGLIHFLVEALIMGTLSGWNLTRPVIAEGLLDSTLLTIFSTPLIYIWVAKPFITTTQQAEAALSREIEIQAKQATELAATLSTLSQSLEQNEELRLRLQKSNEKVAEINERTLQRIGADLHDGPAQLLTYSLLRLGKFAPIIAKDGDKKASDELDSMRSALNDTLTEIRNISRGLSLPQLSDVTLEETIALAMTLHQEQTGSKIELLLHDLPTDAPQALKVCVYRLVQESLANSYKHALGLGQIVAARGSSSLELIISDSGPGFNTTDFNRDGLGLTGMRARVEALGGTMSIGTGPGRGTSLTFNINLEPIRLRSAA